MALVRSRLRCPICNVKASAVHDSELGDLTVKIEHLDNDVHNIVPFRGEVRGHPAILLDPDLEQTIGAWQVV